MQINLSELFIREGKEKTYSQDIEMTIFQAPNGVYEVVSKEPVVLRIQNLGDRKLYMEGSAKLSLSIPCDRCLEPVLTPFELTISETLDLSQSEEERAEELNEQPYLSGYNLDLDQLVGNELLLSLPMKVLCDENCKGICNRCGTNLNRGDCECDKQSLDPRMSVIQDIFKQLKEV